MESDNTGLGIDYYNQQQILQWANQQRPPMGWSNGPQYVPGAPQGSNDPANWRYLMSSGASRPQYPQQNQYYGAQRPNLPSWYTPQQAGVPTQYPRPQQMTGPMPQANAYTSGATTTQRPSLPSWYTPQAQYNRPPSR